MIQFSLSLLLLLLTILVQQEEEEIFERCMSLGDTKYLPEHWDCWRSCVLIENIPGK